MRTIVELTDEQIEQLRRLCEKEGISRAAAIRRGVDLVIAEKTDRLGRRKDALDAVFGMWKDRNIDAVEYQRELRAEWERDVWNQ